MHRLFLHVGSHKTGTTSLQAHLGDHRFTLAEAGLHVLTERHGRHGESANCLGFAHAVLRGEVRSVARMTGAMGGPHGLRSLRFRRAMAAALRAVPAGADAVLSAEALCFARTDAEYRRLMRCLAPAGFEIVPVICFRNAADWRQSWMAELRAWSDRMGGRFGRGTGDIRGDWVFDADAVRAFWSRVGPPRCIDYDAEVAARGNVLPALLSAMEIAAPGDPDAYRLRRRA